MTGKALESAVQKLGAGTASGNRITITDGQQLTVHVSVGRTSMALTRVSEIEVDDSLAYIRAGRGARFAIACEDIGALEIIDEKAKKAGY